MLQVFRCNTVLPLHFWWFICSWTLSPHQHRPYLVPFTWRDLIHWNKWQKSPGKLIIFFIKFRMIFDFLLSLKILFLSGYIKVEIEGHMENTKKWSQWLSSSSAVLQNELGLCLRLSGIWETCNKGHRSFQVFGPPGGNSQFWTTLSDESHGEGRSCI